MTFPKPLKIIALMTSIFIVAASFSSAQIRRNTWCGSSAYEGLGWALSGAGDVNGDGYDDIIVGAPNRDNIVVEAGAAFVYSGLDGSTLYTFSSRNARDHVGFSVSDAGDVDADGFADVIVGAPNADPSGLNDAGRAIVYSGATGNPIHVFDGTVAHTYTGVSVCSLGDINGDGFDDVAVGVVDWNVTGKVDVYLGQVGTLYRSFESTQGAVQYGQTIRGVDIDGDGVQELMICDPLNNSAGPARGRVDIFDIESATLLRSHSGVQDYSSFGLSADNALDVDGDGKDDYLIGAPQEGTNPFFGNGVARLYSGRDGSLIRRHTGTYDGAYCGSSVAGLGRFTWDNTPDYAISLTSTYPNFPSVQIIDGESGDIIETLVDRDWDSGYGINIAGAGDVGADNLESLIIGAPLDNVDAGCVDLIIPCGGLDNNYGAGWPGTLGVPSFEITDHPVFGEPAEFVLQNSLGIATLGVLFIGFSQANLPTPRGGTILLQPYTQLPLAVPATGLTFSALIDDASLCGVPLYLQAIEFDAGASHGLSFTRGLEVFWGFF